MQDELETGNGLEMVLDIARRRKWLAIVIFLAVTAAVFTSVQYLPDVYRSSATVLIERQQIPNEFVRSTVTSALETRLQTISQEILSRSRLEALIDRFGLYEEMRQTAPIEAVLTTMRNDINLSLRGSGGGRDSTTVAFTISYTGRDPQRVAAVANTLASFYIEENLKVRGEQASGTSEFLAAQLREMELNLEKQEKEVSEFKNLYAGELPHQQEGNLSSLDQLNTRLRLNGDAQLRVSERRSDLEGQLAEVRARGEGPDATATRIAQLRQELRQLREQYSDKYPDVLRVKTEIADLVEELKQFDGVAQNETADTNPQIGQIQKAILETERQLQQLQVEADRIKDSIASYERRLANAPLREQQYQELVRDYETNRELYRSLLGRQKEAELAESMEQRQKGEQFRVIEPAFASGTPAAPDRFRLRLLGLLAAIGLAAGAVLLVEQLDGSFHTAAAIRSGSPIPVLVTIPHIVTRADRYRKALRFSLATVATVVGLGVIVAASYYFATGNHQFVARFLG